MPVDGNCKHLGVTFSSDGKWTNHINDIIESSMKQINALRKPKGSFTLSCLLEFH
jgi:hypothetical protein